MADKLRKNFRRMENIVKAASYLGLAELNWCLARMAGDWNNRRAKPGEGK